MKAIIMAGGKGTRLKPLTDDIPKPLVRIIDRPVMEHIIELLKKHNITQIGVTLGHMSDAIMDYFGSGERLGVELKYFVEETPLGTAGGVKAASDFTDGDFLIMSGDCYTNMDLSRAIQFHKAKQSPFTIIATPHNNPVGLGVLEADFNNTLSAFVEKPEQARPSLINTGTYIMSRRILDMIPQGFYDFGKQLLPRLVNEAYVWVTYDYWSDIGTLPAFYYTNFLVASAISPDA
ncbi:MAG: nucleotidyltransferase family protein [Christensenellales bacterium]|jgi:mannose-1-phosphate guanylyltransferase/phosphomannomutase